MPTPRRAHPRHGHPVRLCRAHGISHVNGELNPTHNLQNKKKKTIPTFVRWLPNKVEPWHQAGSTVSSHNHAPLLTLIIGGAPIFANNDCQESSSDPPCRVSIVLLFIHLYIVTRFSVVATSGPNCELRRGLWRLEIRYQFCVLCRLLSCFFFSHTHNFTRIVHSHISYGYI